MTLKEWINSEEAESIRFDLECDCKPDSEIEQILKDTYSTLYNIELSDKKKDCLKGQCKCCWCGEKFSYSDYTQKEYYYFHAVCLKCKHNCLFKKV